MLLLIIGGLLVAIVLMGFFTKKSSKAEVSYQYFTAEKTRAAIENKEDLILLDIQIEEQWKAGHIKGALPTHAYPVKTTEDKVKLDNILPELAGRQPIVVVCPGGGSGATRTIDYLKSKGIAATRLFILENGQSKWPYDELIE